MADEEHGGLTDLRVRYGPGDDPKVVESKPITIFAHSGARDVDAERVDGKPVVVISSPATLEEIDDPNCELHWAFNAFWHTANVGLHGQNLPKPDIEELRRCGSGFKHLAGLINLTLKAVIDQKVVPHWRYPEAHLHPSVQAALADVLIDLQRPLQTVIEFVKMGGRLGKPIPVKYKLLG
jgi:hypothetical protein